MHHLSSIFLNIYILYMYSKVLVNLKKGEILLYLTTWMKLEDIMLNDMPAAEGQTPRDYLCDISKSNSQKQRVQRQLPGAGRRWKWRELLFNECRVSVMQDE